MLIDTVSESEKYVLHKWKQKRLDQDSDRATINESFNRELEFVYINDRSSLNRFQIFIKFVRNFLKNGD